jgi:hypothetical protein
MPSRSWTQATRKKSIPALDALDEPHVRSNPQHDSPKHTLALLKRLTPQVAPIQPENIEGHEVCPLAAKHL